MSSPSVVTLESVRLACACGQVFTPKARFCPECGEPRVQEKSRTGKSKAGAANTGKVKSARSTARGPQSAEPPIDEALPEEPAADEEPSPAADERATQAARRVANRTAQREESQAAYQALKGDIAEARRKALSTLTGVSSVAMLGLAAFGLIGSRGNVLALSAVFFLLTVCFLCWRRDRKLTQAEYLSLPHSQARNGRLRCIHCGVLGATLREAEASRTVRYDCAKCGENLFSA